MNPLGFFIQGLTLVFIHLQLSGAITWSWWYVLAPTWISMVIGAVLAIGAYLVARTQQRAQQDLVDRLTAAQKLPRAEALSRTPSFYVPGARPAPRSPPDVRGGPDA